MKIEKLYARDIVAFIVLIGAFILIGMGVDSFVTGITIFIIGYYFSKRYREEGNESKELDEVLKKIGERIRQKKERSELK